MQDHITEWLYGLFGLKACGPAHPEKQNPASACLAGAGLGLVDRRRLEGELAYELELAAGAGISDREAGRGALAEGAGGV